MLHLRAAMLLMVFLCGSGNADGKRRGKTHEPMLPEGSVVLVSCPFPTALNGLTGTVASSKEDHEGKLTVNFPSLRNSLKLHKKHLRVLQKSRMFEHGDRVQIFGLDSLRGKSSQKHSVANANDGGFEDNNIGIVVGYPDQASERVSVLVPSRPFPIHTHSSHLELVVKEDTNEISRRRRVEDYASKYEEDDARHWINRIDESFPGGAPIRLWRHSALMLKNQLLKNRMRKCTRESIFTGELGVSLALIFVDKAFKIPTVASLETELSHAERLKERIPRGEKTFLNGVPGALCLAVCYALRQRHTGIARKYASECLSLFDEVASLPSMLLSVKSGKAGYLYSIAFLRAIFGEENIGKEPVEALIRQVLEEIKNEQDSLFKIRRSFMGNRDQNLNEQVRREGAYGGILGVLQVLLLFPKELSNVPGSWRTVISFVSDILKLSEPTEGLDKSPLMSNGARWCDGFTGLVQPLITIAIQRHLPKQTRKAALRAALDIGERIWIRGLLHSDGTGLCHSVCANGLALLSLYRATKNELWLKRSRHFGRIVVEKWDHLSKCNQRDKERSLFEGEVGAMLFFTYLAFPNETWFPGYSCPTPWP
mmetsp:Transcript_11448/g.28190  ORF Transcript_11448/g.28190 Transcript_11448/m.28190 type:complete len:596 (+) Transcript_11448:194-1981(+)